MASHMVVQPSRDTLFIRGFSGRRDIQDIREYFERQAGCECTIEFFKQSDMDDALYVALKFETRDIAKDILNRFDDTEVMGDRIELSWFKDLRKAKQQAALERQRYGRMDYGNYGGNYRRYNHGPRRMSPVNRGRYHRERSYSRSASRSRSRSRSPSRGRSREKRGRQASSSSRSSSPEPRPKSSSKLRSEVKNKKSVDRDDHSDVSPPKKSNQEEIKPPNSPDDRSPSRQSARSQEIKPSPKVKRDQSEERKVTASRMSMEDQRVQKRAQEDDSRATQDDARMSRMDDKIFDDPLPSRGADEKSRGMTLEQQRLRRQQDLDREEMARFAAKSSMRNDSMLDAQEIVERRRVHRAFSPTGDGPDRYGGLKSEEERVRLRGMDPASTLFWDDLEDTRKGKGKDRMSDSLRGGMMGDRAMRLLDDEDPLPRERGMRMMDDDDRWGYGADMMTRRAQMQRQNRDMDFSQDAMALVQEKKKEIERVYKNDCETFVTVVKMLISKEPSLEEKLQYSLRENLKEVGQRCILDLREYMDRLRDHDAMPIKMT